MSSKLNTRRYDSAWQEHRLFPCGTPAYFSSSRWRVFAFSFLKQRRVHQPRLADQRRELHAGQDIVLEVDARRDLDQLHAFLASLEATIQQRA